MLRKQKRQITVEETSNIIQFDGMGYPLMLCIMTDGSQQWIDVGEEFAEEGILKGRFKVLEWRKRVDNDKIY